MQKSTLYLINSDIMCNKNHWIRLYEILFKALAILEWETQLNQIIYYRHNLQYLNRQIYHQCMYIYGYIYKLLNHKNIKFLFCWRDRKNNSAEQKSCGLRHFLSLVYFYEKHVRILLRKTFYFCFIFFLPYLMLGL